MTQPETGGASGPGPAFRQFASIGEEIPADDSDAEVVESLGGLVE